DGDRESVSGPPSLDLAAPPRQPRRAREDRPRARAGAELHDGASLHEGAGHVPYPEEAPRPGGRSGDRTARDTLVRAGLCQCALALRLPRGQTKGHYDGRRAQDTVSLRPARRLLAGVLPRAVVPRLR